MAALLSEAGYPNPDGVLFDFGVSSHQLDTAQRGFTYRADAPLDMRMDPDGPVTAADILNTASADDLERIISEYGEERWASRIAEFIVDRRKTAPLRTSSDLVDVIYAAVPRGAQAWRAAPGEKDISGPENRSQRRAWVSGTRRCRRGRHRETRRQDSGHILSFS